MKKLFGFLIAILLSLNSIALSQGTQISGSQIKDGVITNAKIKSDASILYSKLDFTGMPASIVNAENPLTFNTPLSRSTNAISLTTVPVTFGGTGLTSVTAGRILFGGNSTTLGTLANLTFDTGTNAFTVTGTGRFTSTLTVGGTTSFNTKVYTWPNAYGDPGSVLTDAAGNGTITWEPIPLAGVTLQAADPPDTQDTGGINISGKGFFGDSVHMQANEIYFNTSPTDTNDYIMWNSSTDRMQMYGYSGVEIGSTLIGTPSLTVQQVSEGASALIVTPSRFSTVNAGLIKATALVAPGAPTVTPQGTGGAVTWTYKVVALLADGTSTEAGPAGSTAAGNATLDGTNFNHITWSAVTGAYAYDVYRTVVGTTPATTGKITATPRVFLFLDDQAIAGDSGTAPIVNKTGIVDAKYFTTTVGAGVATGATIVPTGSIFHITDAVTPIENITLPYTGFVGTITLLPDAAFTTVDTGNIALASTAVIGRALTMTFDGTAWYPSY